VKIISTVVLSIFMHNLNHSSSEFYYIRTNYLDKEATNQTYSGIKINTERKTDVYLTYLAHTQNFGDEIPESITKIKTDQKISNDKLQLYSQKSFTDTFFLGPKKSFKIFDEKSLSEEIKFLKFRYYFIDNIFKNDDKLSTTGFKFTEKEKINSFFKKTDNEISENYLKDGFKYIKLSTYFLYVVNIMIQGVSSGSKTTNPLFVLNEDNNKVLKVNCPHLNTIKNLVELFSMDLDSSMKVTVENFEAFMNRIALTKPTIMDCHILDRIYYYFSYLSLFILDISKDEFKESSNGKSYAEITKSIEEVNNKISKLDAEKKKEDIDSLNKIINQKRKSEESNIYENHFQLFLLLDCYEPSKPFLLFV